MASEFTRNIKNLSKEQVNGNEIKEFTDVNDLVSSKDNKNYIKKPDEKMHCLTDNVKIINTSNELLSVSQDKENNIATLTVNHDRKREQVLKSSTGSISIIKGLDNVGDEKTDINITPYTKVIYNGKENQYQKLGYIKDNVNKIIDIFTIGNVTADSTVSGSSKIEFTANVNETNIVLGDNEVVINGNSIILNYVSGQSFYYYEKDGYIYRVFVNLQPASEYEHLPS